MLCSASSTDGHLGKFLDRNFFQELLHNRYLPTPDMYEVCMSIHGLETGVHT